MRYRGADKKIRRGLVAFLVVSVDLTKNVDLPFLLAMLIPLENQEIKCTFKLKNHHSLLRIELKIGSKISGGKLNLALPLLLVTLRHWTDL